jgi:hypothetical protein
MKSTIETGLMDCSIQENSTLHLSLGLLGGFSTSPAELGFRSFCELVRM